MSGFIITRFSGAFAFTTDSRHHLVGQIRSPLLVIAGDGKRCASPSGLRVYDAAESARELGNRGADHNDYELLAGHQMLEAVLDFVNRHIPPTSGS